MRATCPSPLLYVKHRSVQTLQTRLCKETGNRQHSSFFTSASCLAKSSILSFVTAYRRVLNQEVSLTFPFCPIQHSQRGKIELERHATCVAFCCLYGTSLNFRGCVLNALLWVRSVDTSKRQFRCYTEQIQASQAEARRKEGWILLRMCFGFFLFFCWPYHLSTPDSSDSSQAVVVSFYQRQQTIWMATKLYRE